MARSTGRPHLRFALIAIGVAWVGANHLAAQSDGSASSAPQQALNALVVDKSGTPDTNLQGSDFRITVDGMPRTIQSAVAGDAPISLAFVIDTSGSMHDKVGGVNELVETLIKGLPRGSEVMVVLFNDKPLLRMPFTQDSSVVPSFLQNFRGYGGTALFDAVIETEAYIADHARNPRRSLVLISDGDDNASHNSSKETIPSIEWSGAPTIYSVEIHVEDDNPQVSGEEVKFGKKMLNSLSESSGGLLFEVKKNKDFELCATKIVNAIRGQYVVRYSVLSEAGNAPKHKIQVGLATENKSLTVHAIKEYQSAAQ